MTGDYPASTLELRHGYTMAHLDAIARTAVRVCRWRFLPHHERYELAKSAIAEHLYTRDDRPASLELIRAGELAIRAEVEQITRLRGITYAHAARNRDGAMPKYWMYWWPHTRPTTSPENRIVDVLALRQIWPRLTPLHQSVLVALATHGDYRQAAASLGKTHSTFMTQISAARKQFLRLWHQHETPSRPWGHHSRRSNHNTRTITGTIIRRRKTNTQMRKGKINQARRDDTPPPQRREGRPRRPTATTRIATRNGQSPSGSMTTPAQRKRALYEAIAQRYLIDGLPAVNIAAQLDIEPAHVRACIRELGLKR